MRKLLVIVLLFFSLPVIAQQGLDVNTFKQTVLDYSQDLKADKAEYQALQYAIKVAKTAYYPSINGAGTFNYSLKDRNYGIPTTDIFFPLKREDFAVGAEVLQPVYAGGAIRSAHKTVELQGDMAETNVELTVDNVLHGAEVAYWGAVAQLEMYKIAQRYVEIVAELHNMVEIRYLEGKISKTDFVQTESRLLEAKVQYVECKTYYELALQNMNIMMGRNPYEVIMLSDSLSSNLELPMPVNASDILHTHPQVVLAELQVKNQEQMIKKAVSPYNPSLYAGFSESWGSSSMNVDNKGYWGHALYMKLSVPIFNFGARYKVAKSEKERLQATKFNLQKQVDQVVKEVTDAWTVIKENVHKIMLAEDNIKIADENLDLNTFSYNEGKLTILDVLSAQATWLSAYSNMISLWHSQHIAICDYNKATSNIK